MKKILSFTLFLLIANTAFSQDRVNTSEPIIYVDPLLGTGNSTTESAMQHSEGHTELKGQTFPAVGVPHGMTNWTPQTQATEEKCFSPYYFEHNRFQGFRASHWMSGSCTQDYGSVTVMVTGPELKTAPDERASSFSHSKEESYPDYYKVYLDDYKVLAELTGDSHAGIMRFTFDSSDASYLVIEPNSDEGEGFVEINPDRLEISGYNPVHRIYQGWGKPAGFSGYFVIRVDQPFTEFGTWNGNEIKKGQISAKGNKTGVGAFIKVNTAQPLKVKVGMSFTSLEQARKNLEAEIPQWDFAAVRKKSRDSWNEALGKVQVKGGSKKDKVKFYTALYHTKFLPRVFSDVDGTYPGFGDDEKIHQADGFDYYADYSMWDTYRSLHPLLTILEPKRSLDMVKSMVLKAEQGGWLPIFPAWNQYTAAMVGDHGISLIGDAYMKGITGFDVEKAYTYMRKNAFQPNTDQKSYEEGMGRRALQSYLEYGYIPLEDSVLESFHQREQVSRTLEYAYDDFVLSQLAKKLGKEDDYQTLIKRAKNYRHVIDTTTGFARGRYADGSWVEPFDPFAIRASFITEGSPFQYTWYVPHDVAGLIKELGGKESFIQKLDLHFEKGYYWHGNEPGHQVPYLYPYAGAAWKTQQLVRHIIKSEYDVGPGGLSGNEDSGQMSAWLVMSMMGFYPVCPGMPYYVIGSPFFQEAAISFPGQKKFIIKTVNNSQTHPFIQSATLNGEPFDKTYLEHSQLMDGGELVFKMGAKPNPGWGKEIPPSMESLVK